METDFDGEFPYLNTPKMKVFGQKIFKNTSNSFKNKPFSLMPILDPKSRFYAELKKMDDMMKQSFSNYRSVFVPIGQTNDIYLRNGFKSDNSTDFFVDQTYFPQFIEDLSSELKIDTVRLLIRPKITKFHGTVILTFLIHQVLIKQLKDSESDFSIVDYNSEEEEEVELGVGSCAICMDVGASYMVIPCRHLYLCYFCQFKGVSKCAICNTEVFQVKKVVEMSEDIFDASFKD